MHVRKKVSLFPINTPFGAASAEVDSASNTITLCALNVSREKTGLPAKRRAIGKHAMILPSGHCFYRSEDKNQMLLANIIFSHDESYGQSIKIDENINPGMIALLGKNKEKNVTSFAGVTANGKQILVYSIYEGFYIEDNYEIRMGNATNPAKDRIGTCVFDLTDDKRKIRNMLSCQHPSGESKRYVVIGYDNGAIQLFVAEGERDLQFEWELEGKNKVFKDMELQLTEAGTLVAYSPSEHLVKVWKLSSRDLEAQTYNNITCPHFRVSPNGHYLVTQNNAQDQRNMLCIYNLPASPIEEFSAYFKEFKSPICGVTFDAQGRLVTANPNEDDSMTVSVGSTAYDIVQAAKMSLKSPPSQHLQIGRREQGTQTPDIDEDKKSSRRFSLLKRTSDESRHLHALKKQEKEMSKVEMPADQIVEAEALIEPVSPKKRLEKKKSSAWKPLNLFARRSIEEVDDSNEEKEDDSPRMKGA